MSAHSETSEQKVERHAAMKEANAVQAKRATDVARLCADMIAWEEIAGPEDANAMEKALHPALRFRTRAGDWRTREEFLTHFPGGANRGRSLVGEVDVTHYGDMAVAVLLVRTGDGNLTRNVRVFLRGGKSDWQLVSWCNEPAPPIVAAEDALHP
jgi:hypothetical protein